MAPIIPNPRKIKSFRTGAAFESWLRTEPRARDRAVAEGLQEGLRRGHDFHTHKRSTWRCAGAGLTASGRPSTSIRSCSATRRAGAKSVWSQINREHVARLTAAGRMTPHGQRQVDAAKADGRWHAAYAPIRSATTDTVPDDLRAAIDASPRARRTFLTLGRLNLFALAFRTNNMKTAAGRARKIAALVAMLERGETIVPERRR